MEYLGTEEEYDQIYLSLKIVSNNENSFVCILRWYLFARISLSHCIDFNSCFYFLKYFLKRKQFLSLYIPIQFSTLSPPPIPFTYLPTLLLSIF